jgi:hypothetical protein
MSLQKAIDRCMKNCEELGISYKKVLGDIYSGAYDSDYGCYCRNPYDNIVRIW